MAAQRRRISSEEMVTKEAAKASLASLFSDVDAAMVHTSSHMVDVGVCTPLASSVLGASACPRFLWLAPPCGTFGTPVGMPCISLLVMVPCAHSKQVQPQGRRERTTLSSIL